MAVMLVMDMPLVLEHTITSSVQGPALSGGLLGFNLGQMKMMNIIQNLKP